MIRRNLNLPHLAIIHLRTSIQIQLINRTVDQKEDF